MSYQIQRTHSSQSFLEKKINNYTYNSQNLLGKGSYSSVYLGTDHNKNTSVAIKIIENNLLRDEYIKNLIHQECKIMNSLTHTNVVHLHEVLTTMNHTYIIQEYCNQKDLRVQLAEKGVFTELEVIEILQNILQGFKELLKHGIIHRDIKPANILINDNIYKIADFGFAIHVNGLNDNLKSSLVGTPLYMSPQCLRGEFYSTKNDIWSLGIIVYELIYGDVPWPSNSKFELIQAFNTKPLRFPNNRKISANMRDFIEQCLKIDEVGRIDWEQIYKHPLLKGEKIENGMVFSKDKNNKLIGIEYAEEQKKKKKEREEIQTEKREIKQDLSFRIFGFIGFLENISLMNQKMSHLNGLSQQNLQLFEGFLMKYACEFIERIERETSSENQGQNVDFQRKLMNCESWAKIRREMKRKHHSFIGNLKKLAQQHLNLDENPIVNKGILYDNIMKAAKDVLREANHLLITGSIEVERKKTGRIDWNLFQYVSFLLVLVQMLKENEEDLEQLLVRLYEKSSFPEIKIGKELVKLEEVKKLREHIYELD